MSRGAAVVPLVVAAQAAVAVGQDQDAVLMVSRTPEGAGRGIARSSRTGGAVVAPPG
jgi:hypothetical protein